MTDYTGEETKPSITFCKFFPTPHQTTTTVLTTPTPSVCDKSIRYVAEENIRPVSPSTQPSEAMLRLAGRYFKRWDEANRVFVSNVRDEYPDD